MELIVGSYNHVLFGFEVIESSTKEEIASESISTSETELQFKPRFTDQGHAGCIKSVACNGRYLASGSTDETIRLFDMRKHVEIGTLVQQSGSITTLAFTSEGHLLSASEDGTICIWKCKTWDCEKVLKGHRGAITSISVHPSGRLALSVSKDKTIRTWNLLTGRCAYTTTLKNAGEIVRWSPSGDSYAVVWQTVVTVHQISAAEEQCEYQSDKYVLACEFITDKVLAIAGESENIVLFDITTRSVLQKFQAHDARTKAFHVHQLSDDEVLLFSVSSDGNAKVCQLKKDDLSEKPLVLASMSIPARPICITLNIDKKLKSKVQKTPVAEEKPEGSVEEEREEEKEEEKETVIEVTTESNKVEQVLTKKKAKKHKIRDG